MSTDEVGTGPPASLHGTGSRADSLAKASASAVLRLRGLPFLAVSSDIREFFCGFDVREVYVCRRDGEAYVVLHSPDGAQTALQKLNKKYMGSRYIELFEATEADLAAVKKVLEDSRLQGFVVRLRGLPYSATVADVTTFLAGVQLAEVEDAIVFAQSVDGRPTGEAYVELADEQALVLAMTRHKELMGNRYIEIFNSSKVDKLMARCQQGAQAHSRWTLGRNSLAGAALPNSRHAFNRSLAAPSYVPVASMADQLADALSTAHISVTSSPEAHRGTVTGGICGPAAPPYPLAARAGTVHQFARAPATAAAAAGAGSVRVSPGAQPVGAAAVRELGVQQGEPAGAPPHRLGPHLVPQGPVLVGPDGQVVMQYYMHPQGGVWHVHPPAMPMVPAAAATAADAVPAMRAPPGVPVGVSSGMQGLGPGPDVWGTEAAQYMAQPVPPMMVPAAGVQQGYAPYQWQQPVAQLPAGMRGQPPSNSAAAYMYQGGPQLS